LNPESYQTSDGCDFSEFIRQFRPERLAITCDNIHEVKIGRLLGTGEGREAHEGDWHGTKVAIKIPFEGNNYNGTLSGNEYDRMLKEASVLQRLERAPNINRILGWCNKTIVVEKAEGTLDKIIHHRLTAQRALEISLDIAKGVQQLHTLPIGPVSHGDIKTSQFLYDSKGRIFLGDLNHMKYSGLSSTNTKCNPHDEEDIHKIAGIMKGVLEKVEHKSRKYLQAMQDLIGEALDSDPVKRPSATEMTERIEAIGRKYGISRRRSFSM